MQSIFRLFFAIMEFLAGNYSGHSCMGFAIHPGEIVQVKRDKMGF